VHVWSCCLMPCKWLAPPQQLQDAMQQRSATLPTVFTQWLQLRLALLSNKPHCFHRHTHVSEALHPPLAPQVLSELASVNIRLFPFAAALAKRGHTVLVSDPDHLHQVPIATLGPENKHIKAPNHHEHTSTQSKPAAALLADASDLRADTHA